MVSSEKINRLRKEANTIYCNLEEIEKDLENLRHKEGDHWEENELNKKYESPSGEKIEITLDIEESAVENAKKRYQRAKELEKEYEKQKKVEGPLVDVQQDALAFLILYHLKKVKGDYPKSISYNLDIGTKEARKCCKELKNRGLLEQLSSGMLKRKKVKLKRSLETHQHHTYYGLSQKGSQLLRYLDTKEGKKSFLYKLKDARRIAKRLNRHGPDYSRKTAKDLEMNLGYVRKLYKAMLIANIVEKYDGSIIKDEERKITPKKEIHKKHTYYVTTEETDIALREMETT